MTGGVATSVLVDALRDAGQLLAVDGSLPDRLADLTDDSRGITAGACFVAVKGSVRDGHAFLDEVVRRGASCAMVEGDVASALPAIRVRESRTGASVAAAAFFGQPARGLSIVGVTGTNGKTTTVGILRHLLHERGAPAASIGTLGVLLGDGAPFEGGAGLTTPGPIELHRVLRRLADAGVRRVAMEVSSHALDQRRVHGLAFAAAVFTNLTRDHLDYHGTLEAYFAAKARLVGLLAADGTAVVNADDPAWVQLPPAPRRVRFARTGAAEVRAEDVRFTPRGSAWLLRAGEGARPVVLPLIGDFNVDNALGAAAAALAVGRRLDDVAARLATVPQVPGRLEVLGARPTVLRDYAHTPDALARALAALRPFTPGRLIVVFGCGGDRDRGKRPLMADAARAGADRLVVTSDNPRTEDPERIIDEIVASLPTGSYERIEDRRAAIAHAIAVAEPTRDVVLLAGKGHETYQIRGTERLPFDEARIVREIFASAPAGR